MNAVGRIRDGIGPGDVVTLRIEANTFADNDPGPPPALLVRCSIPRRKRYPSAPQDG